MKEFHFQYCKVVLSFYSDEKRGWFTSTFKEKTSITTPSSRTTSRTTFRATAHSIAGITRSTTTVKRSSVATKVTPPAKKESIWDLFTTDENQDTTTTTTAE